MIGHLIANQPWFLEQTERSELKRLGDLLTFDVEQGSPLVVQYLYPRNSTPQNFPPSKKYEIQELGTTRVDPDPGYYFDAEGSRVLKIRPLK
jgi:hypothetical protein